MISLQALDLGLVWLGVVAGIALPVRYWIGAKWWRNPLGWVIMQLAAIVILLYAKSITTIVSGAALNAAPSNVAINGFVVAFLIELDVVVDYLIRKDKREMNQARERHAMTVRTAGRYGRRTPKNAPAIRFGDVLRGNVTIPPHPATEDYLARMADWQMLGNNAAGNCVAVTWANMRRLVTAFLSREVYPSQEQVWAVYKTQNPGFDPSGTAETNGPGSEHDQGMDIQTLLEYLVKVGGPDGVKALAFAKVAFTNTAELEAALAIFGGVWTGIEVSEENQDEFSDNQPWDAVGDVEGAHSVLSGGYTPNVRFITWAAETTFTPAFVEQRVEEAWIVVWPEHAGTEAFEAGIDRTAFVSAYKDLTGKDLVLPEPAPTPTPGPQPVPVDGDADHVLADALRQWAFEHHVGGNEKAARAAQTWMSAKGL